MPMGGRGQAVAFTAHYRNCVPDRGRCSRFCRCTRATREPGGVFFAVAADENFIALLSLGASGSPESIFHDTTHLLPAPQPIVLAHLAQ